MREAIEAAVAAHEAGDAPINAVEGFVRQILGWREFIRGVYWLKMPDYAERNFFDAQRDLPSFYWTGETEMVCLSEAVSQTRENAYAHHIQSGDDACPFNFLYWDFIARNRTKLEKNPRMGLIVKSLQRMKPDKVAAMRKDAEAFLSQLETVEEGQWQDSQ